jgi:5-hydroxyisourate hydrolase
MCSTPRADGRRKVFRSRWKLKRPGAGNWLAKARPNADGRISELVSAEITIAPGVYRLIFDTGKYFAQHQSESFYPQVTIVFRLVDAAQHYHVPLLLSPFGYSTYRGS